MSDFVFEQDRVPSTRIKVVGVGGGGSNAVDSMVDMELPGVEFYAVNTDAQALENSRCRNKIQIGREVTGGMGAGGDPILGEKAAVADRDLLTGILEGGDMAFVTACLGGGTGTGAAPVVAELAKSLGLLTVAVVTKPFQFEGPHRKLRSQQGIDRLREYADALIVVMNDKLLESVGPKTPLLEAFAMVNNILAQGVKSISDLISMPGLINADFQDVRAVMGQTGGAVLGFGVGKGENRAAEAVKKACSATLQEKIVVNGARQVLVSLTGGQDMTLNEAHEAASLVYEASDPDANIIFSAVIDPRLTDEIRVTIIATGFGEETAKLSAPSVGAREKPIAAFGKSPSSSPGAAALAAEFGVAKAGPLPVERVRSHALPDPRVWGERVAGTERTPVPSGSFQRNDSEEDLEPIEAGDKNEADPLNSWKKDLEEERADEEPAPPVTAERRLAPGLLQAEEPDSAEAKAQEDTEENLEIPAIIRRRRSFFS